MQTLTPTQSEQASGGILWTTPVAVAILDAASLGPLALAFGAGFTAGTYIYQNWISE